MNPAKFYGVEIHGDPSFWVDADYSLVLHPVFPFRTEEEAETVVSGLSDFKQPQASIFCFETRPKLGPKRE